MEPKIIGKIKLIDSVIKCNGTGNVIYVDNKDGPLILKDTVINFAGNNGLLFTYGNKNKSLKMKATINNECIIHIGKNASFNKKADLHLACSEKRHIFIGDDPMFSNNIWFRTGDAHPIYNVHTMERINHPKSIIVGDHVWIGQDATILKGTIVGSGSIIGASSVVSNKTLSSNSAYAGAPARLIGEEGSVFFDKTDLNGADEVTAKKYDTYENPTYIYYYDSNEKDTLKNLREFLNENHPVEESINFFKALSKSKNRFYVAGKQ